MADSNQEKIFQLESRIENMLDKLIESDEELDSNGSHSSLKFSEDISSTEVEKDESVKEFPLTPSQKTSFISFNNSSFLSNNIGANQTISSNMNLLYKNYNPFSFNYKYDIRGNNMGSLGYYFRELLFCIFIYLCWDLFSFH